MGTIKKGILGGFSGKVGNVVGASWKSVSYIRSLPANVRNPRTVKQVTQRTKFSMIQKFVRTLLPVVRVGFKGNAGGNNSAYGAAISYNLLNAVKGVYPDFEIDFENASIAKGTLYGVSNPSATCSGGRLNIDWGTEMYSNARGDDRVAVIAYNPGNELAVYDLDVGARDDGAASLDLPPAWMGHEVETYLVFSSTDGTLVSDSIYTGRHEITAD